MKDPRCVHIRENLARRTAEAGLSLPEAAYQGLEAYFELLRKWNARVSLTSLAMEEGTDDAVDRLLIEPAIAATFLPDPTALVIDIGSGGGSPAIPIKLVTPGLTLAMVESKHKKAAFLREAIRHLSLTRTTVEAARFEELLERPVFRGAADVVTLRAVKIDPVTLETVQRFLKPGGLLFLFSSTTQDLTEATAGLLPLGVHPLLPHLGSRLEILRKTG